MPVFELETPDGAKYEVEAPDEQAAYGAFQKLQARQGATEQPSSLSEFQSNTGAFASDPGAIPSATVPTGADAAGDKDTMYLAQKAARAPADVIGAIPDLVNMGVNTALTTADSFNQLFGGDGIDFRFPSVSDAIANAASSVYEGAGGEMVGPEEVDAGTRTGGEALRFGLGALVPSAGLAKMAQSGRDIGQVPVVGRALEPLAAPYKTGNPVKTIAGDAIAGAGSGAATQGYEDNAPDWLKEKLGPFGAILASIAGGLGANTIDAVGSGITTGGLNVAQNAVRGKRDYNLPTNPETGMRPTRIDVEEAARVAQKMPSDIDATRRNIREGKEYYSQFADKDQMPTTGMLADDIGVASDEGVARGRNRKAFAERDRNREALASNMLESVTPEADSRKFTDEAVNQYDTTLRGAEEKLAGAEAAQDDARRSVLAQNADLEQYRASQPQVSSAMAEDFNAARTAGRMEKNARYDAVDPKTPVDGRFLGEEIDRIDEGMSEMERMSGGAYAEIAGRVRARLASEAPITYDDLKILRQQISEARTAAVAASGQSVAGSGADVRRLDQLGRVVNNLTDEINPEAAQYYREQYAPRFKQGRASEYGAAVDRANRTGGESSATRPSEFGDKFLRKPEDAASYRRAMEPPPSDAPQIEGPTGAKGEPVSDRNAREWMLGDLAKSGVLTDNAEIRYNKFKQWTDRNRKTINQFPELAREVDSELAAAQRGGALSKQLAADVAEAKSGVSQTKRELDRSSLAKAIDRDPEHAVGAIMGSSDPERQMADMVSRLEGNKEALDGLKSAVRDWIVQKKGDGKNIVGFGDLRHVNPKGIDDLMRAHEKTLSKLYTPQEMNTLRRVQKLATAPRKLDTKAMAGSDTHANILADAQKDSTRLGRMREAALKMYFGMLTGGGINRSINLALETLPNNQSEVGRIVESMFFDPDVAEHLLNLPVRDRNIPMWNAKLNRLLAYSAGGRESSSNSEEDDSLASDVER